VLYFKNIQVLLGFCSDGCVREQEAYHTFNWVLAGKHGVGFIVFTKIGKKGHIACPIDVILTFLIWKYLFIPKIPTNEICYCICKLAA
jgi:hypothetical protein